MDPYAGGGGWTMIPSVPTHSNVSTPTNQDHLYLSSPPRQQQPQFHPHQFQQQQQQQQRILQQQQQQQLQQNQHHQSLASHFHLLHLVENLGDAIDNGSRDQHFDALVNELNNHFEKCQQLLNSIASSINNKSMTVEEQKRKLEESEQYLNQRKDLIAKYRSSVEDLVKTEP